MEEKINTKNLQMVVLLPEERDQCQGDAVSEEVVARSGVAEQRNPPKKPRQLKFVVGGELEQIIQDACIDSLDTLNTQ